MSEPLPANAGDTIAALGTAAGRGAIGLVRVSGPAVPAIARAMLGALPVPRQATLTPFYDANGEPIDHGLALYFPAPHSYTGEAILELHGHGGQIAPQLVLEAVLALGARAASPGEFSLRAFLNEKLDLNQAESVADLIDAGSRQAARAALASLSGEFSSALNALSEALIDLRVWVEAAIDFSDEEIDFLAQEALNARIEHVAERLQQTRQAAGAGEALREGLRIVIAGAPNAGKSSLLNRLAGADLAIVTDIPGTTRDVIASTMQVGGLVVHLADTAGLRAGGDAIEQEGMRRSRQAAEQADHILWVHDDSGPVAPQDALDPLQLGPQAPPVTWLLNKIDRSGRQPGACDGPGDPFAVCAKTGAGLDVLRQHLGALAAGGDSEAGGVWLARERHIEALSCANTHFEAGVQALHEWHAGEIFAEELRLAQQALAPVIGKLGSDALLGEIFGRFCIGK